MTAPILWWKCEDNSVESQAGVDAIWNETPAYDTGSPGRAFSFSMSGGEQWGLSVPNNALFNFNETDSFSIRFKVKRSSFTQTYLICKGRYGTSTDCFLIGTTGVSARVFFRTVNSAGVGTDVITNGYLLVDTFYDILFTYANGYIHVYLDNSDVTPTPETQYLIRNLVVDLYFNYLWYSGAINLLDEIRIYNKVISTDNIDTNNTHNIVIENGLIKSWDIVEGGTLPVTPNTHEVIIENGLIKEWNISSGGSRPSPSNNHAIDTLKGLVQSWVIT